MSFGYCSYLWNANVKNTNNANAKSKQTLNLVHGNLMSYKYKNFNPHSIWLTNWDLLQQEIFGSIGQWKLDDNLFNFWVVMQWLKVHPKFLTNSLYVTGDSYLGIIILILVQEISYGNFIKDKHLYIYIYFFFIFLFCS